MLTKRPDTLDSFNDADVDDYSTQDDGGESTEPENQGNTLYFGQQEEKDGEFMVNAMDVEELRRSQRRCVRMSPLRFSLAHVHENEFSFSFFAAQ